MRKNLQATRDIVERIGASRTYANIYTELSNAGHVFGYEGFILSSLPERLGEPGDSDVRITGWPPEWERRYLERRYGRTDPVIALGLRTGTPFMWSEAIRVAGPEADLTVMNEARVFGLDEGLCIPIHEPGKPLAGLSFAGPRLRLSPEGRANLQLVGMFAHTTALTIGETLRARREAVAEVGLTPREVEVLQWAADGHTTAQIAEILTLTDRTIELHFQKAAARLGASNRVHAVAQALRLRIID